MASTLIGVYDTEAQASAARDELQTLDLPQGAVRLRPAEDTGPGHQAALRALEQAEDASTSSLSLPDFFRSLSEGSEAGTHGDLYLEAVKRGSYLLVVTAEHDAQHERILDILERHHPFDIDERAESWRSEGWTGYNAGAPVSSDSEVVRGRSLYENKRGTRAVHEVQGDRASGESESPDTGKRAAVKADAVRRGSVRIYQHGFR